MKIRTLAITLVVVVVIGNVACVNTQECDAIEHISTTSGICNVDLDMANPLYFDDLEPLGCEVEEIIIEEDTEPQTKELELIGAFRITAYCPCAKCCGHNTGITATGTVATQGRTIAVDPEQIPYGTAVVINGQEYIAEDCGGGIGNNCIDIFFNSHEDAIQFGMRYAEVFVKA